MLKKKNGLLHIFPFIRWFPYPASRLRMDLIAGLTVALVLIPQAIAYAQLAGLPAQYGLYAACVPVIIGGLWGSSSHLATGPTAITALIAGGTVLALAPAGSPEYLGHMITLAFLVGIIRLATGLFRLSFVINFLAQPVLRGFLNAGAIIIGLSQLNKILGLPGERNHYFFQDLASMAERIGQTHIPSLAVGLLALGIILLFKKVLPKLPSALFCVLITAILVLILKRSSSAEVRGYAEGIEIVGNVPRGIPIPALPGLNLAELWLLLPGALVVTFIGFMEVGSVSKAIALKSKEVLNFDQEMIGQGLASFAGSFFQSFPTSGSLSRTALTYESGGKTGMSAVFTGILSLGIVLFGTKILYYIPQAALAGIIITSVLGLVDFRAMGESFKVSVYDGICAVVTFIVTIIFSPNMVYGILAGAGMAVVFYLFKTMKPRVAILGLHADGTMRDADLHKLPVDENLPHFRFDGRLYFASAPYFEETIMSLMGRFKTVRFIIVHAHGINDIDASGELMLRDLVVRLKSAGVTLCFVGLKNQVSMVFDRTGLSGKIGKENMFRTAEDAEKNLRARLSQPGN